MDIIEKILSYECKDYNWKEKLKNTAQNPKFHLEGNVFNHVALVLESLIKDINFNNLEENQKKILLYSAVLHDIGKPFCSKIQHGKIISPNHAIKGSIEARKIIYKFAFMQEILGELSFFEREEVCSLIKYHTLPTFFSEKEDIERKILKASLEVNLQYLTILSRADILGRKSEDKKNLRTLMENLELFTEYCEIEDCTSKPKKFLSDRSKFLYIKGNDNYLHYKAYETNGSTVYLMSGLPASGKDTYIKNNLKDLNMVSLDNIRKELNITAKENQGKVVQEAKTRAKKYLAKRESFIWNATNISFTMREQLIELFLSYSAKVNIIYCETSYKNILLRNNKRELPVPEPAINRMISNLEAPNIWESDKVRFCIN